MDGLVFRNIARLIKVYNEAKIDCVGMITSSDYLLDLYQNAKHHSLFISLNPNSPYISVSENTRYSLLPNNHFSNILKTHIEGGIIKEIKQLNDDRILQIKVAKRDDIGEYITKYLIIEMLGKMTNLILCKEDYKIIDAMHRLGPSDASKRTLYQGAIYRLPIRKDLNDPLTAKIDFNKTFSSQLNGISPLIEEEWSNFNYSEEEIHNFVDNLLHSNKIYIGSVNNKLDYHFLPLKSFKDIKEYSWNEGISNFYQNAWMKKQKSEKENELMLIAKKELTKLKRKLVNLNKDLENSLKSDTYKKYGDLLLNYADLHTNGLDKVTINGIVIPLDKKLDIIKNANRYFDKYHKAKNSSSIIQEQIDLTNDLIEYFELLQIQISDGDEQSLLEVKKELVDQGYLVNKTKKGPNKKVKKTYNVMKFTSKEDILIEVGKNNIQNDYLTFSVARYNEYFFHVKDFPGAHVIVHATSLNEPTIRMAANLAAYYSKARYSSSVPVDYTLVKNIKKPKGYVYGRVVMLNYKTIYIDPEKPQ